MENPDGQVVGRKSTRRKVRKETLHLMEHSSNHNLTNDQLYADLAADLSRGPDVLGITEMRAMDDRMATLQRAAKDFNYTLVAQPKVQEKFFVKTGDHCHVAGRGRVFVVRGNGLPAFDPDGITTRYVSWVEIRWNGMHVFVHIAHWETGMTGAAQARAAMAETKVISTQVRKHARGVKNVSFFMGDMNYFEGGDFVGPNDPLTYFRNNGLQLVYDELNVTPVNTHGHPIDVIGGYKPDDRVEAKRYKVYFGQNSDHRAISAWYDIEIRDRDQPEDPRKTYESSGNINWGDYRDSTIYPLPYAVDDSDTFNG